MLKHRVSALSSASCSESLGWCLKVNAINLIYFSFASLFFALSPTQPPSNPQTSSCSSPAIPPFIPAVPPSLHPSLWHSHPPFTSLFHPSFFASFLPSCPPRRFPSISRSRACICLETSLSPWFLSVRLHLPLPVCLCLRGCHYILKLINGVCVCVSLCVCASLCLCACNQRSFFQWNDSFCFSQPESHR